MSDGLSGDYGRPASGGLYEILEEVTEALIKYKEMIDELVENERPIRLAYRKKEDEKNAKEKEKMHPENLEKVAEHLLKEAERFNTEAAKVRTCRKGGGK